MDRRSQRARPEDSQHPHGAKAELRLRHLREARGALLVFARERGKLVAGGGGRVLFFLGVLFLLVGSTTAFGHV